MDFKVFKEIAEEADLDMSAYSGRGMYGRQCPSFRVDDPSEIFDLGIQLERARESLAGADVDDRGEDYDVDFPNPTWDNLGLGYVVYFKSITISDEELKELRGEDGEDEDE